jgi:hypothetical protein
MGCCKSRSKCKIAYIDPYYLNNYYYKQQHPQAQYQYQVPAYQQQQLPQHHQQQQYPQSQYQYEVPAYQQQQQQQHPQSQYQYEVPAYQQQQQAQHKIPTYQQQQPQAKLLYEEIIPQYPQNYTVPKLNVVRQSNIKVIQTPFSSGVHRSNLMKLMPLDTALSITQQSHGSTKFFVPSMLYPNSSIVFTTSIFNGTPVASFKSISGFSAMNKAFFMSF